MHKWVSIFIIGFLLAGVSGCGLPIRVEGDFQAPSMTLNPLNTSTPTPFLPASDTSLPTFTPSPSPTATRQLADPSQRAKYLLEVDLDYQAHHLLVNLTIDYPNQSGVPLDALVLAVEADRWPGAFLLEQVQVDGKAVDNYQLADGRLDLPLDQPLAPGDSINLDYTYELKLPWNGSNQIFGYNNWQENLVDWYPFIVPFSPTSGWLLHEPANVGEHLVYDAVDFEVLIRQLNQVEELTIAASAPAESEENGTRFRLNAARSFVFSASDGYQTSSAPAGSILVTSYYASGHEAAGQAILNAAVQAVDAYSRAFGTYPYQSLSIVETIYPDGMEYDGLFFLSRNFYLEYDGTLLNNLVMIGIHEVAHMWWFGLVGNDQAEEPWLDEALSTYSEEIFYEQVKPGLVGYWWNFRVNDFQPMGKVDISIYEGGSFRPYTDAVYLRAAKMMENLRTRLGDDSFFAFLKDYASQMSYQRAIAEDFFRILYTHTSTDISDIIATYFQYPH